MKKLNIIAVLVAAFGVILLSNGIMASAENSVGNTTTASVSSSPDGQGGKHGPGFMGFGGMPGMEDMDNVTVTATKTDNGITINKTSSDTDTITKLHDMADQINLRASIKRDVQNISNGIVITTTSDNADAVKMIQEMKPKETDKDTGKFKITSETISNGTKETITSDDTTLVEKLQSGKNNNVYGIGMGGMMGGKGGDMGKGGDHGRMPKSGDEDTQSSGAEN